MKPEPDEIKLIEHADEDPGEMCITIHNVFTIQVCVALIFIAPIGKSFTIFNSM